MDIDNNQPLTTPVSHQCVLNTLGALCMDESIIHEVIPRLIEHVQRLCNGECQEKDIFYLHATLIKSDLVPLLWPNASINFLLQYLSPPPPSLHKPIKHLSF